MVIHKLSLASVAIIWSSLAMPGEVSVYPFVNVFPKTKHLPLLQFVCKHIHVCAHCGWSLNFPYENGTLGLPQFLTEVPYRVYQHVGLHLLLVCRYLCVPMCENTPWMWNQLQWGNFSPRRHNYVASSLFLMPCVSSGRHLLISLQIWAWWDWHHHSPNSHAQAFAGSAQTRSSQFMMILRCLALVIHFQAGLSLACFWGSGPDAVFWKMPESYLESDGREPWQGSVSWAPRAGWPQSLGMQLSCLVACTHLHESVPDLGLGRKVQRGGMFAEKHATLIMGLELIIGRI